MPTDENDWLFDFVLQFLESDRFDSAVMDFVDEKCEVFDNEDENKFIYSDIHIEFREHIEALLSSNLGELGVTSDFFFEACLKGRNTRDINRTVYDRMIAMDDFQTFKKIMVKRNMELQMEALKSIKENNSSSELEIRRKEEEDSRILLERSLIDMELIHKQEQLEQLELEQALAISLAIEEERLRLLKLDSDIDFENEEYYNLKGDEHVEKNKTNKYNSSSSKVSTEKLKFSSENKSNTSTTYSDQSSKEIDELYSKSSEENNFADAKRAADEWEAAERKRNRGGGGSGENNNHSPSSRNKKKDFEAKDQEDSGAKSSMAPIKLSGFGKASVLPPIKSSSVSEQTENLEMKRKLIDQTARLNQQLLQEQKKSEDELKKKIDVGHNEEDIRAKHLREQRDRLIALKKKERDDKVLQENERNGNTTGVSEKVASSIKEFTSQNNTESVSEEKDGQDVEKKRADLRMALARRMKLDLISGNEKST